MKAVAVTLSIACPEGTVQGGGDQDRALGVLAAFRRELYRCFSKRPDALAELSDAVLCKPDRVHMLAELSLVPECRRGHGAVYDAVNSGRMQIARRASKPSPWPENRCASLAGQTQPVRPPCTWPNSPPGVTLLIRASRRPAACPAASSRS